MVCFMILFYYFHHITVLRMKYQSLFPWWCTKNTCVRINLLWTYFNSFWKNFEQFCRLYCRFEIYLLHLVEYDISKACHDSFWKGPSEMQDLHCLKYFQIGISYYIYCFYIKQLMKYYFLSLIILNANQCSKI